MVFDFIFYTSLVCLIAYLTVMVFYYKTLLGKERTMRDFMKTNLDDTEIVIRKLQVQLQRSLGNIDILTDELNKIKGDVTNLRTRNSQYRLENDKLNQHIKELEGKIRMSMSMEFDNSFTKRAKEIEDELKSLFNISVDDKILRKYVSSEKYYKKAKNRMLFTF